MKAIRIDHIGIAVEKEGVWETIGEILGIKPSEKKRVESEGISVKFLQIGDTRIELLYPENENSTVKKFIEKRGPGIHHIAIEVENLENSVKELKQKGFTTVGEKPVTGAEGYKAIFIHPKSTQGVLLELIEK